MIETPEKTPEQRPNESAETIYSSGGIVLTGSKKALVFALGTT
jgi:hypothetical protein